MLSVRWALSRLPTFSRCLQPIRNVSHGLHSSSISAKGLKILFCGSDNFSVQSLKALIELKNAAPNKPVESIDVLVKQEKPSGRGLKAQRVNPVQVLAKEHDLPYHELNTSIDKWKLPGPTDLIIAVSFGAFIPKTLIEKSRYGGLNVHPSFLPKYRGAAPVQHALINGDPSTGVVVQTLDVEKFDRGKILAKSDPVNIKIDETKYPSPTLYNDLLQTLGEEGGKLLAAVINNGLYDPKKHASLTVSTGEKSSLASRLPTTASLIQFGKMTGRRAFRLGLVFGHLYCFRQKVKYLRRGITSVPPARTIMGPLRMPTAIEFDRYLREAPADKQWVYIPSPQITKKDRGGLALQVSEGEWVIVKYLTVEGRNRRDAMSWADIVDPTDVGFVSTQSV
ncbi:Methionyl-tRNA formyltransferase [Orbilia brochopaga]|uniref:methionyl-tRNA formyltransferase n=1 Tax=Orbilia brochopaga TaxID=3140254 RepID=A0AAV9V7T5_9PEZI